MSRCFPTKVSFKNVFSRKQNKDVPKVPFKKLFSRKKDMKESKGEELPLPFDDFGPPDEDQIARQEWSDSINFRIVDNIFQKVDETYDFIIVGAGSAGCVLARELYSNIPNISILVLEAGPPTSQVNDRMRMACAYPTIFRAMDSDWGYVTTLQTMPGVVDPSKVVENPSIIYPRGKIFGGCSSTGGMVYMRGQKADYDGWAAQGPEYSIWNYDGCLEAFKAVENNARQNPDDEFKQFHGFTGLLHVEDSPAPTYKIVEDVSGMAQTIGMPLNTDFNGARQNGVGKFQHTKKDGKRFTLADGYLADALNKVDTTPPFQPIGPPYGLANATGKFVSVNVKSAAYAMNIIWDTNKPNENVATGVKYYYDGQVHNALIAPKGEVIVCGGAINSPKLLMLSGIGPRKNLEDNQITVRKELPVGNNLKDHPLCYISGQVNVPNSTSVTQLESFNSSFEVGMIFKGNTAGTIPVKDDFLNESPDMQLYVTTTPFDPMIATKTNNTPTSPKFETISIIPALNSPTSVGHIELSDSSPFDSPKIFPTFYETPEDLYRMISALKFARELLKQPPLSTNWGVKEIGINDDFGRFSGPNGEMSDENWETYIRAKTFTSFHPCCTVKMGPEDKGGCVNERLQVYGATNLRVVDASIFPTIPRGNLNAIAAMVGWRASKIIEEDYGKK